MFTSDNVYKGGLSFNSGALLSGLFDKSAVNGGFNFDLPLATIAQFNSQAMDFTTASQANRAGFFKGFADSNVSFTDRLIGISERTNAANIRTVDMNNSANANTSASNIKISELTSAASIQNNAALIALNQSNSASAFSIFDRITDSKITASRASELLNTTIAHNQYWLSSASIQAMERNNLAAINANVEINRQNNVTTQVTSDSGGCFITTAICKSSGKPDDCDELQILRKFRDDYMMSDKGRRELVAEYYENAPSIVEAIDNNSGNSFQYTVLRVVFLVPAIEAIKKGDNEKALILYRKMYESAKRLVKGG